MGVYRLTSVLLALSAPVWSWAAQSSSPTGHDAGINLPPQQGDSGTGAFLPGVYNYPYSAAYVDHLRSLGFNSLRLPINVATALNSASLTLLRSYIDAIGGRGVLCMFGTANSTTGSHGTGIVDDVDVASSAWARVHEVFASYPNVKYEIFNEPQGYKDPKIYLDTMLHIIKGAGLPEERCIVAATGWEQFPLPLEVLNWKGNIGYHFYPWWLPDGTRTRSNFSNIFQTALAGISSRTYVTEYGADLSLANRDYEELEPSGTGGDVNCLQGMNDAVVALKSAGVGIKGAFHWHGWNNTDAFNFFGKANTNGSVKVRKILADAFPDSGLVVV